MLACLLRKGTGEIKNSHMRGEKILSKFVDEVWFRREINLKKERNFAD